jgi:hypothetical protein
MALEVVAVAPKSQVRPSGVATGASNAAITFRAAAAKAGSAKVGTGDAISTLRAAAAGVDLRIIGNCFMNTSFETVRTDKDHVKPGVTLAVNSLGDFTHVMLIHPLQKRGIDLRKVNCDLDGRLWNAFACVDRRTCQRGPTPLRSGAGPCRHWQVPNPDRALGRI